MDDRLALLEARVATLEESLRQLEARLAPAPSAPDGRAPVPAGAPAPRRRAAAREDDDEAGPVLADAGGVVALLGRVFMGLAGAFLVRALTDSGTLPNAAGAALGLAYAAGWAVLADRAGRSGARRAATAHGLLAALVAYPLVVETSTRLGVLSPPASAATLAIATAGLAWVAWRRTLVAVAWAAVLAAVGASLWLVLATHDAASYTALLLALGAGSLWLTYGRRWHALRWPPALGADLAVLVVAVLAGWPGGPPEEWRSLSPAAGWVLGLALVVVYPGSFAARTLARQRRVNAFEVVQTVLALLVGFGGAVRVALATGTGGTALGAAALLLACGGYGAALGFAARRPEWGRNFLFFTSIALLFALAGGPLALGAGPGVVVWCLLGLAASVGGARLGRESLEVHAAVYLVAAAAASGLLGAAADAWLSRSAGAWRPLGGTAVAVAVVAAAAYVAATYLRGEPAAPARARVPAFLLAMVGLAGASALVVSTAAGLVSGGGTPGLAAVATVRTGVLSVATLVLAAMAARTKARELGWLVWPLLAFGALKLVFEDLPSGRPLTLFPAFALYGVALILSPRLLRERPLPGR